MMKLADRKYFVFQVEVPESKMRAFHGFAKANGVSYREKNVYVLHDPIELRDNGGESAPSKPPHNCDRTNTKSCNPNTP